VSFAFEITRRLRQHLHFAPGKRSDMKLDTLLQATVTASLTDYPRNRDK
jgi:hypothetical protein